MQGGIEAAGDLATGGMLARAAEPHAGEAGHDGAQDACLNCGTGLVGDYCHACGQSGHVHKTMGAIGHDIAHGVLHFDGKIWRTLPMLAFKPGELTRRYIDGERARFVSPMALFLFSVFLMFAIVANLPGWHFGDSDIFKPGMGGGVERARENIVEQREALDARIARLTRDLAKERAETPPNAETIARYEQRIGEARQERDGLAKAERLLPSGSATDAKARAESESWLEHKIRYARDNPKLLLYKVKTSAYKFSWALIPISLPFLWLLFPLRRDVGLYDHAIFATYSLTFMSLLVIVLAILGALGAPTSWLVAAALLIPPFHMYRQLKGTYRLGRAGALWRLWWLLLSSGISTILFILLLLYMGVAE